MEIVSLEKDKSKTIKFRHILPAIIRFLPRVPSMIRGTRETKKMKSGIKTSMGTIFEKNAVKFADRPAIKYEDIVYTHSEYNQIVNQYAHYMLSLGIKKGDSIIIFLDNRPEILFFIGAVAKIGAIVAIINSLHRGPVLKHSLDIIPSVKHFIIGEELVEAFEEVKGDLNLSDDSNFYYLPETGTGRVPDGYQDWNQLIKNRDTQNPSTTAEMTMAEPFVYVFTSGTTGMPKASISIQGKWITTYNIFGKVMLRPNDKDTLYVPLPLYHGSAMYVGWPAASSGGAAVAIRKKFSASEFWADIKKFNATSFIYIGELCRYIMDLPPNPDDGHNTIRSVIGNGLRIDSWKAFKSRFNIRAVYEFYGASEANISFVNMLNLDCTLGVCPVPYTIVKYDLEAEAPITDENGFMQRIETGEAGLLLGRISDEAPFVGYTDEEESKKKIRQDVFEKGDVWFDSGDLVRDIGFKHTQFVDRIGDTFRWKGENVSTVEVEAAVNSFEQISQAAVYGATIPGTNGRVGMAAIIAYEPPERLNLDGLYTSLVSRLPSYAVPAFIRYKTEFESTATMKIKKVNLKKEGFDVKNISDPIYVCLPGSKGYVPLTEEIHQKIVNGEYRF